MKTRVMLRHLLIVLALAGLGCASTSATQAGGPAAYRGDAPVNAAPDGNLYLEAEEFVVADDAAPGWQAKPWGENYYAATFFNTFLSRKAFLGAPAQCDESVATIRANVPRAGRYMVLSRYEMPYRFEARFRIQIEQNGKVVLDRQYGARENLKIWPFRNGLKDELRWYWGAVENIVWEGHDAIVELQEGVATVRLIADEQPTPAGKRNVDMVLLSHEIDRMLALIDQGRNLPFDGQLTQAGDVWVKVHNHAASPVTVNFAQATEHSPYWVHGVSRRWQPRNVAVEPGQASDWVEVGNLLDSMNDGQWGITAASGEAGAAMDYTLEFGLMSPAGEVETINTFANLSGNIELAYDADTRYTRRIRTTESLLYELLDYVKAHDVPGRAPKRFVTFCYTFEPREGNEKYNAARAEFVKHIGISVTSPTGPSATDDDVVSGYTDLRSQQGDALAATLAKFKADGVAEKIRTVSLGDEISLPSPSGDAHEAFRDWAKAQGLKPADLDPAAGDDWQKVQFNRANELRETNPHLFYYANRFAQAYGIEVYKDWTDTIRAALPNADTGANYSPHHTPMYLGETYKWITIFRRGGMTQPWSEDYIWQVPVGSQQMLSQLFGLFRAGVRYNPEQWIHFYVMPHWPGNTTASWRRNWYTSIAGGMKIGNLFEFRPVQAAYTENHVSLPEMYVEVKRALWETGTMEDILLDGQVRMGNAALWYSPAGDIWGDFRSPPHAGAKRTIYVAAQHRQLQMEVVDDEDAERGTLDDLELLILTDFHVSQAASKRIAAWVEAGGRLLATAGAGMFDEFNEPNTVLRQLLGVEQTQLVVPEGQAAQFEKQDLPFTEPYDTVTWRGDGGEAVTIPVVGARSDVKVAADVTTTGTFADGGPAVTQRAAGKGAATYIAFQPGMTYFKPAMPMVPPDRGTSDDSSAHFVPTDFDPGTISLLTHVTAGVFRPVVCADPLVQTSVIESEHGTVIPLINWRGEPIKDLIVYINVDVPRGKVRLVSGGTVTEILGASDAAHVAVRINLDVADALVFEK